jgi:hypothetical protein
LIQSVISQAAPLTKGGKATSEETCNQRFYTRTRTSTGTSEFLLSQVASRAAPLVVASFILQLGLLNENFLLQEIRRPIALQFV